MDTVAANGEQHEHINVLLADDHAVVRRGLKLVLETDPHISVICEASDGVEAVREALANDIDLAVLDITMPRMGGLEAAREICHRRSAVRVLMLSVHDDEQYVAHARRAGAHGYVRKSAADHDLIDACWRVIGDTTFIEPDSRMSAFPARAQAATKELRLTPRECEILALIAQGNSAKHIADMLVISHRTVERHRENLMTKLNVHTSTELTRHAIRLRLVEP